MSCYSLIRHAVLYSTQFSKGEIMFGGAPDDGFFRSGGSEIPRSTGGGASMWPVPPMPTDPPLDVGLPMPEPKKRGGSSS